MAAINKRLAKGVFSAVQNTVIYTSPPGAGNYTIVKSLTICNKLETSAWITLVFAGVEILAGYVIAGRDTVTIPVFDQIIHAGETIYATASAEENITYYMSGKEVTPDAV